ncbi:AAA family ATPase [Coraliomargarita sp. W4R53]
MHIISVQLQNYRKHQNCSVALGKDLTLIHGPNESGKSTLVEAIHRTLFLKAKGTSEVHKAMQSNHGGQPIVTLKFAAAGKTHTLQKQFSGTNGTATLQTEGEAALTGDAAEEALAHLLQVDGSIGGAGAKKALPLRWAHLWVWQGSSNLSPLDSADESQAALRDKLQEQVGEGLSVSATDNQLIARLQELHNENYTSTQKLKAGSPLKTLEDALEKAAQTVAAKEDALAQLESAAQTFTQAENDLQRHQTTRDSARKELESINAQLKQVTALQQTLKDKQQQSTQAAEHLKALQAADKSIRQLEVDLKASSEAAAPQQQKVETLQLAANQAREQLAAATTAREQASQHTTLARAQREAWQAHADLLKASQRLERLQKTEQTIATAKQAQQAAALAVTKLEAYTPRVLKALRKKQQAAEQTQSQLEAHALRLEILTSDAEIQIDGVPLPAGSSQTLTQASEIQIGTGTRLKLTPGSSSDLNSAREQAFAAQSAYQEALQALGVSEFETAERRALELQKAVNDLEKLQGQLDALAPAQVADDLQAQQSEISRLEAQRDKPVDGIDAQAFPQDTEASEQALEHAAQALKAAADAEQQTNSQEKALRSKSDQSSQQLEQARASYTQLADKLKTLDNRLQFEREQWGETEARSEKLIQAQAQADQAQAAQKAEQSKLNALGPDDLALDHKRLNQVSENSEQLIQTARDQRAHSQALLQNNGSTDPERELKEAQAEAEQLAHNHTRLQRQANARSLLLQRLKAAQGQITEALTQPLEAAAAPYLESLFGHGSQARLQWAEDGSGLTGFSIDRSQNQNGYFSFEQLSHGTREQVALALRLAMAEVLAADHDGQLPMVLDDAFTHADKERIKKIQRLLYRAADRGLQIILLSCHPENYSSLTANEVALS